MPSSTPVCIISGQVCNVDGSPNCEVQVVATIESTEVDQGGQFAGGAGITSVPIETFTDDTGAFSITLIQGAKILLEIPDINMRKSVCVPTTPTANFADLV